MKPKAISLRGQSTPSSAYEQTETGLTDTQIGQKF